MSEKDNASKADLRSAVDSLKESLKSEINRVDKKVDGVAMELVQAQARLERSDERLFSRIVLSESRLLRAIDEVLGRLGDHDRTTVVLDRMLKDHRITLDDHERRLMGLEARA